MQTMETMNWVFLSQQTSVNSTFFDDSVNIVYEADFDASVKRIFEEVASKLGISYSDLEPQIQKNNPTYFGMKHEFFQKYSGAKKTHMCVDALQRMLKVPHIGALS